MDRRFVFSFYAILLGAVILSEAKDLLSFRLPGEQVLRVAQDDRSVRGRAVQEEMDL